jgi:hypothetical protein
MQTARSVKHSLRMPQQFRKAVNQFGLEDRRRVAHWPPRRYFDRRQRGLAATGSDIEFAPKTLAIHLEAWL